MTCKWIKDSQRFTLEHFDVICRSPPQIYHTALPLSPSESWLREYYCLELSGEVRVVKGVPAEWGSCIRTISFESNPTALACWKDNIAVGFNSPKIVILDATTGIHTSVLSGCTGSVKSLAFSPDGMFLVSGSHDCTVNLWDIQTGGIIKTLYGHTGGVSSVSISSDCTTIASGSHDMTIHLWNTWTWECHCVIHGHNSIIKSVTFSPKNSQLLISVSTDFIVWQWDIDGCQTRPIHEGNGAVFSSDGIFFVSWMRGVATVQNSDSGAVVVKLHAPRGWFKYCCFSPDGKVVTGDDYGTIYVWDITSTDPHIVNTFVGHTSPITFLTFSSSLISLSWDGSIKLWEIGAPSTDLVATDPVSTPPALASIASVGLQVNYGIAISTDSTGVVRTWDIMTGLCKAFFHTPAGGYDKVDVQLINGKLILAWYTHQDIRIWDTRKGQILQIVDALHHGNCWDLRISGDGLRVFLLDDKCIRAWSIWTGEVVGEVKLNAAPSYLPLVVDGSRVWVHFQSSEIQGWDFEFLNSAPVLLSDEPPESPHLDFIDGQMRYSCGPSWIEDGGVEVFHLSGRFAGPSKKQWDGRYLVAGYHSGELLILDFNPIILLKNGDTSDVSD